ncbi:MAG: hypothetical protein AAFZ15_20185 [Bacteroidota bacterium]
MKINFINSLLLLLLFLVGCNKIELEDPPINNPVFSANVAFNNGENIFWEAGIDSFYMYTEYEYGADEIFRFIGRLEKENCTVDCNESLSIIFRNSVAIPQSEFKIEQAFENPRPPFSSNEIMVVDTVYEVDTTSVYRIFFDIDTTVTASTGQTFYEWFNGPEIVSSEMNPVLDFTNFPNSEFMLKVTELGFGDSCVVWQKQFLSTDPTDRCAVYIQPNYNVDFFLESLVAVADSGLDPFNLLWNNGTQQEINTGPFEPGFEYSVTLTDNNDCQSSAGFLFNDFVVSSTQAQCSANFDYEIEIITILDTVSTTIISAPFDSLQFSAVTIIYTDKNGNEFRSDRAGQNPGANFTINNVEEYELNEKGEATQKLEVEFNCQLWDGNLNVKNIISGNAIWGVAHPN